jgi:broad specificity phosphatase PhoE
MHENLTILLIRHAEKPDDEYQGVNEFGVNDPESLTPRGWQRAGALAVLLAGSNGSLTPDQIYASSPDKEKVAPHIKVGSKSSRALETVTPLAEKLNKTPIQTFGKGNEQDLVDAITTFEGTTLTCWQHEEIPQ